MGAVSPKTIFAENAPLFAGILVLFGLGLVICRFNRFLDFWDRLFPHRVREGTVTFPDDAGQQYLFDSSATITVFSKDDFPGIPGESWVQARFSRDGRLMRIDVLYESAPSCLCQGLKVGKRK